MSEREDEAPYRITLEGASRLQDLPVREVAAFLDEVVRLIARGAGEILQRPIRTAGRYEGAIEDASHIRLARLTSGSIVAEFLPADVAEPSGGLGMDADSLSEQSFDLLMDVAASGGDEYPELATALSAFVDRFVGRREGSSLRIEDRRPNRERHVLIDADRSAALSRAGAAGAVDAPTPNEVAGRIFEANLEARTALVRTPGGGRVQVMFGPEHDADVKRVFGDRAALRGDVRYDPRTNRIKSIRIHRIMSGNQLSLDSSGADFWTDRPASALVAEAGTVVVTDAADLELTGVSDEEWTALYEALGVAR